MGVLFAEGNTTIEIHRTMQVTDNDFRFMVECLERDIATMLVEDCGMTIHQALDTLFTSETDQKLHNPQTGLYFQSPCYVFSILQTELSTGKMG